MKTILIVEDDKVLNEGYSSILSDDYRVLSAFDGQGALDILKKVHVDLIVLDLIMPNMNGQETLKKIREQNISIKILILTALTSQSIESSMMGLGAGAFLRKPVSGKQLSAEIKKLLKD